MGTKGHWGPRVLAVRPRGAPQMQCGCWGSFGGDRHHTWHHTAACPCSPEGPSASALTPAAGFRSVQLTWEGRICHLLYPKAFPSPLFQPPSLLPPPGPPGGLGRCEWEGAAGTERGTQHFCCSHAAPYTDAGEDLDTLPGLCVGCRHESQPPAERRMLAEPCCPRPCTLRPHAWGCAGGLSVLGTGGGGWQPPAMSEPPEEGFPGLRGRRGASLPV